MPPAKQPELNQQHHSNHTSVPLPKIQSHLATAPRTGKLKGKVAIITGVGSLKGIGYSSSNVSTFVILTCFVGGHLRYPLPMKVGKILIVHHSNDSETPYRRSTSLSHGLVRGESS